MDLERIKHVHFIGIGGIGMSALARLFLHEKKKVSGSDRSESEITKALVREGVRFYDTQVPENISPGVDLVVYTDAMAQDHPELVEARASGIKTVSYFEALSIVANPYYLIAVSGTHGKTTTTAMLADIFEEAALDPSVVVGSLRAKTKTNYRAGKSKYFIAEACEYRRHFLFLKPTVLVITNIEEDHLDYYRDLNDIISGFQELAASVPEDGAIIANLKDKAVKRALKGVSATLIDYTEYVDLLSPLKVPGMHNRMNAAAARAVAHFVGLKKSVAEKALKEFAGTWRRFEFKGTMDNGAVVYDDYAHHPSELRATIAGARELYPDRELTVVFQPHLYSRTRQLFPEFAEALALADYPILTDIYAARERNRDGISSKDLVKAIEKLNPNALYAKNFDVIVSEIRAHGSERDVIVICGAGDIYKVADALCN